jgi:hypothetical protein
VSNREADVSARSGRNAHGFELVVEAMTSGNISRREFLRAGSLGIAATAIPDWLGPLAALSTRASADHCIMLLLVGGPSQLDTWDMKPDAVSEVRGPFRPINTNVDGIQISEIFPRMAKQADKFALVRSVHSRTKPLHNLGCQEMQTGRVFTGSFQSPHCGSVVARFRNTQKDVPGHVVLSRSIQDAGANLPLGQCAGFMGDRHSRTVAPDLSAGAPTTVSGGPDGPSTSYLARALDFEREPLWIRESYGDHEFGRACLVARRLVEHGVTFITVNMFDRVIGADSWDIHGSRPFPGVGSYRDRIGPMFDSAYSALVEDLHKRGLLQTVLVLAVGEFGRTPRINSHGGRDHWTGCRTAVFAGGGVRGGQVIGSSDAIGSEPRDRPVMPAQIVATVYHGLGVPVHTSLSGPSGTSVGVVEPGIEPIFELF